MEEKKSVKISLSTFFLILAIIVILVMGIFMFKLYNEKVEETKKSSELQTQVNSLNGTVSDLQGKIDIVSNTINNVSTSNTNSNYTTKDTETNINESNNEDNKEELIGKWNTYKAINSKDGNETTNMRDVFGSSYSEFGSYLELKDDGSFLNAIQPITDGSKSIKGSYTVKRDYYNIGDCYIFLTYSDGSKDILQRVYYDDSTTPYLVLDSLIGDYQISLKK